MLLGSAGLILSLICITLAGHLLTDLAAFIVISLMISLLGFSTQNYLVNSMAMSSRLHGSLVGLMVTGLAVCAVFIGILKMATKSIFSLCHIDNDF